MNQPAPESSRPSRRQLKKAKQPILRSSAQAYAASKAGSFLKKQTFADDDSLTPAAETWLTRAVTVQRPFVLANLRRLRRAYPSLNNRQLGEKLNKEFILSMTGSGAAIGASAAVPGVGTIASLGLSAAATGGFLEMSALYAQSVAELSGISTEDPQRAKVLVMAVMLGDEGRKLLKELAKQSGGKGTGPLSSMVPLQSWGSGSRSPVTGLIVNQLRKQFIKRFFARQGTSMAGRAIPFGIGAVVGGVGNRGMARKIVKTAQHTFGELPEASPQALIDDFHRSLERERFKADRRDRRNRKKAIHRAARAERQQQRHLKASKGHGGSDGSE